MALKLLNKTETGDLVVYDRGYPAVCFYKDNMLKNVDFCIRIVKSSNVIKTFLENGKYSEIIDFPYTEKSLRRCRKDKISMNLSAIRPDRRFFRQDRRNKTNKYPINYKCMC